MGTSYYLVGSLVSVGKFPTSWRSHAASSHRADAHAVMPWAWRVSLRGQNFDFELHSQQWLHHSHLGALPRGSPSMAAAVSWCCTATAAVRCTCGCGSARQLPQRSALTSCSVSVSQDARCSTRHRLVTAAGCACQCVRCGTRLPLCRPLPARPCCRCRPSIDHEHRVDRLAAIELMAALHCSV